MPWLILMLSCESNVPIIDVFMLRRLLAVPQELLLNPFFVRSPAKTILMLASLAWGLTLIGTLWVLLLIRIDLLVRSIIMTRSLRLERVLLIVPLTTLYT